MLLLNKKRVGVILRSDFNTCFNTKYIISDLDRVLRTGLRIILGQEFISFEKCIFESKLKYLQQTGDQIVKKFVRKTAKHGKFSKWFPVQQDPRIKTRSKSRTKYNPVMARTTAYKRSAIPTLTTVANNLPNQTWDPIR